MNVNEKKNVVCEKKCCLCHKHCLVMNISDRFVSAKTEFYYKNVSVYQFPCIRFLRIKFQWIQHERKPDFRGGTTI